MKYKKLTPQQRKARRYAQNYPYYEAKVDALSDMRQAIRYDVDKVQTSPEDKMLERAIEMDVCTSAMIRIDNALVRTFHQDYEPVRQILCYQIPRKEVEASPRYWRLRYTKHCFERMSREFYDRLWEEIKEDI